MKVTIRGEEYELNQVGSAILPLLSILGEISENRAQMAALKEVNEKDLTENIMKSLFNPVVHGKIAFSISRLLPELAEKHPKVVSWVNQDKWVMALDIAEIMQIAIAATSPQIKTNEAQLEIELPEGEARITQLNDGDLGAKLESVDSGAKEKEIPVDQLNPDINMKALEALSSGKGRESELLAELPIPGFNQAQAIIKANRRAALLEELALLGD